MSAHFADDHLAVYVGDVRNVLPTLIVSDRPGPGHRTRRLVVRLMDDDLELHGPVR